MEQSRLTFIGGGNMARSLIGGLIASGRDPAGITVADPDPSQREHLRSRFGIEVTGDNAAAAATADVVILATKPQILSSAVADLAPADAGILYVSVAAGIREVDIHRWLGGQAAIVRAMPNTPALLGCGVTALYANEEVSADQRESAEHVLRAAGAVVWIPDEPLMDAVTALSGSGPAYFFMLLETMVRTGVEMGLTREAATLLAEETALGAARMALESGEDLGELRRRVTSPGGTTAAAMAAMEAADVPAGIADAIRAARTRSSELAQEFGSI